jgi:hypothetical protein
MTKKETMLYDIQSETLFVRQHENVTLPVQISGTINEDVLKHAKYACVMSGMKYVANHLVMVKKDYPRMDEIDVELEADFVILPQRVYNELIKYLDE